MEAKFVTWELKPSTNVPSLTLNENYKNKIKSKEDVIGCRIVARLMDKDYDQIIESNEMPRRRESRLVISIGQCE